MRVVNIYSPFGFFLSGFNFLSKRGLMRDENFRGEVEEIIEKDPRFPWEAYEFVRNAVTFTTVSLGRHKNKKSERHVKGGELLSGVTEYAVEQFGPMAADVMENWNLKDARSIGAVIFNMIAHNLLSASPDDSPEDFNVDFDFVKALRKPFEAQRDKPVKPPIIA